MFALFFPAPLLRFSSLSLFPSLSFSHSLTCASFSSKKSKSPPPKPHQKSMPAPLAFTEAGKTSRVWARLFDERPLLAAKLSDPSLNITIENHEFGMPPAHFFAADTKYPQLKEEFEVLNTAVDRKGVEYVATIEHKRYPFFGVQVGRFSLSFLLCPERGEREKCGGVERPL